MSAPEPRRNLERKAACADLAAARAALLAWGARVEGIQGQVDTYFPVAHGRLKLRIMDEHTATLIWYARPDQATARLSAYHLVPVRDGVLLRTALSAALGVRGEVRKRREVLHWHNVRLHLDAVDGLGTFVEMEAVLSPGDDETTARHRLHQLGQVLGLRPELDLAPSYADLLGI